MWSCSHFFAAALSYLSGRQHFSFSHSRCKDFILLFKRNWSPLFFLSLALAFSLLSTPMQTLKLSQKKESASLLLSFISKSPGGYAIYCRNARVLEVQTFTPAYMKRWTYVRTIFSEPKFLACKFSYPWCSAARASRARALLIRMKTDAQYKVVLINANTASCPS